MCTQTLSLTVHISSNSELSLSFGWPFSCALLSAAEGAAGVFRTVEVRGGGVGGGRGRLVGVDGEALFMHPPVAAEVGVLLSRLSRGHPSKM